MKKLILSVVMAAIPLSGFTQSRIPGSTDYIDSTGTNLGGSMSGSSTGTTPPTSPNNIQDSFEQQRMENNTPDINNVPRTQSDPAPRSPTLPPSSGTGLGTGTMIP